MTVYSLIKQPNVSLVATLPTAAVVVRITATDIAQRAGGPPAVPLTAVFAVVSGGVEATISGGSDGEVYLITVSAIVTASLTVTAELEVVVVDGAWSMEGGGAGYLSVVEFVDRFGLDEVVRMTDRQRTGRIDRQYLVAALRAAQGLADINLAARYVVPLTTAPDAIKDAIADLACARLYPRGAPDGVAEAAKEARALLGRIASGALPLPLPVPAAAAPSETPVLISPGRRMYRLEDFR